MGVIHMDVPSIYDEFGDKNINKDSWINTYNVISKENKDDELLGDEQIASMVNEQYTVVEEEDDVDHEYQRKNADLVEGMDDVSVEGVIVTISPVKRILPKRGAELTLRRILVRDDTGDLWINAWEDAEMQVTSLIENGSLNLMGDHVIFTGLEIRRGYNDTIEATWSRNTRIVIHENTGLTLEPTSSFEDLVPDETYHLMGVVVFKGVPIPLGSKRTKLAKLVLRDVDGNEITINAWRNTSDQFVNLSIGEQIIVTVSTSEYNGEIQYTYEEDWHIIRGSDEPSEVELALANEKEINNAVEGEVFNISGVITRILKPRKYSDGYIYTYIVEVNENEHVRVKLFGFIGDSLNAELGDYYSMYHGMVSYDEYSTCNELIMRKDSAVDLNNWGTVDPMPLTCFPRVDICDLEEHSDTGEYIDIDCLVLRVDNPITYQREDETAGTVCKCVVADKTGIAPLVIWGGGYYEVERGKTYNLYNLRVRFNENHMENEINMDNNTRVVPDDLDTYEIYKNNFHKVDDVDDITNYEYVEIEGKIDADIFEVSVYEKCPRCNATLTSTLTGLHCRHCETDVAKPRILYKLVTYIMGVQVVLWGDVAEKLWKDKLERGDFIQDKAEEVAESLKDNTYAVYGRVGIDNTNEVTEITGLSIIEK